MSPFGSPRLVWLDRLLVFLLCVVGVTGGSIVLVLVWKLVKFLIERAYLLYGWAGVIVCIGLFVGILVGASMASEID